MSVSRRVLSSRRRLGQATRSCIESLEQRTLFNTITLTSTADDGSPGTLRAALAAANNGDTIDATGLSGTITLNGTALSIPTSVTITGPGASTLTISGNNASQIFNINSGGVSATISGLTLSGGTGDNNGDGGAITDTGSLTLNNDVFTNNSAASAGAQSSSRATHFPSTTAHSQTTASPPLPPQQAALSPVTTST